MGGCGPQTVVADNLVLFGRACSAVTALSPETRLFFGRGIEVEPSSNVEG